MNEQYLSWMTLCVYNLCKIIAQIEEIHNIFILGHIFCIDCIIFSFFGGGVAFSTCKHLAFLQLAGQGSNIKMINNLQYNLHIHGHVHCYTTIDHFEHFMNVNNVQSDLGYPATSGPAHIRISDFGRIWEICLNTASSVGLNTSDNVFTHCYSICNKLSFI